MRTVTRRVAIFSASAAAIGLSGALAGCSRASQTPVHLSADRRFYNSAAELFAAADAVVRVRVGNSSEVGHVKELTNGRLGEVADLPTRIVTVTVVEAFKGHPGASIRVAQTHGKRPDGVEVIDDDDRLLGLEAEYVLFLNTFADTPEFAGAPAVVKGGSQGQFRVSEGQLIAVSDQSAWSLTLAQLESMR